MKGRTLSDEAKLSLRMVRKTQGHPDGNRFKVTVSGHADSRALRRVREILHAENPRCHWCSRVTANRRINESLPPSTATIDHIISRFHRNPKYDCEVVLSCYGCNQDRAVRELAELSPEEIRERSTRPPRKRNAADR